MRFLWFLSSIVAITLAIHRDASQFSHGYHVHKFQVKPTSMPPIGYENAMNATMELEMHAGDHVFQMDLQLITRQWGEGAQIITEVDENGNPTKTLPLFHRGYTGTASVVSGIFMESGSATVTFFEDGRASLAVTTQHDIYNVELNEFNDGAIPLRGRDAGHGMHMTKFTDLDLPEEEANEHRTHPFQNKIRQFLRRKPGSRHLNQLIPFTNCFSGQNGQRAIYIGLMADPAFESKVGGSSQATNAMIADLNKASNEVYSQQLRVWLMAGSVYVGGSVPNTVRSGSTGTCSNRDTSGRLTRFRDWRRTLGKDRHALFHLFTNCHPPPGTVGLAYVNQLCSSSYGVGWTNFMNGGRTWLVFAHEVGHNFGSPHSFDNGQGRTGGIMDYGDGYYPAPGMQPTAGRRIAFNPLRKNDICGGISRSLNAQNSWLIPPNQCWKTYGGGGAPTPTPVPAPVTRPTPRPTRRPTPLPPSGTSPCTGLTMTASWYFNRNNAGCWHYMQALRRYKPCIQTVTSCSLTTPANYPTYRLVKMRFTTSRAVYNSYNYYAWRNGMTTQLRNMGITFYRRRRLAGQAPPEPAINQTAGDPVVTYEWVLNPNMTYGACTPACGSYRYQLESYVCQQNANFTNGNPTDVVIVADETLCGIDLKPIGTPRQCSASPCSSTLCGNGVLDPNEACDTSNNNCCMNCQSYATTPTSCLSRNRFIDAAFMTCLNDVAKTGCYLYLFQGEYFVKYYAVPGYESFYQTSWTNGAIKHRNIFQPDWSTLTAVAGGRNGQVWAFNGLEFRKIDYSNENSGKVISSGSVNSTWQAPAEFVKCGSVTAADVVSERWLMLFCHNIYIYVYIPTELANTTVFPADSVFPGSGDVGVNSFYFDSRDNTYRIIRRDFMSLYRQPGLVSFANSTMPTVFGTGSTPAISTSQCVVNDPECISCSGVNHCTACNPQYKVLVNRCIPENTLIDMQFTQGSQNDQFYSSDPVLQSATFTVSHGNVANAAMEFTPTTHVLVRAPTVVGRTIKDFRIEVFYKPYTQSSRESLITIDSRFELDLQSVPNTNTMKLWVRFDGLTFDCYVAKPLTVNTWNLIAVEFANRQIITSVNGFEHNRAFQNVAGGPPELGLTFQNVTIGAQSGGLNGALDSLQVKEVPVAAGTQQANGASEQQAWVIPVIVVATFLGLCLICGIAFLAYSRGLCGEKSTRNDDGVHTAFLSANQTNGGGDYIAM